MSIAKRFARSVDKGAETLVFLASAPEVSEVSGQYFQDCHIAPMSNAALNNATAQRLWIETNKLAGLTD